MKQIQTFDLQEWEDNSLVLVEIFSKILERLNDAKFSNFILEDDDFIYDLIDISKLYHKKKFNKNDKNLSPSIFFDFMIHSLSLAKKSKKFFENEKLIEFYLKKILLNKNLHNEFLSNQDTYYYFGNKYFSKFEVYAIRCKIIINFLRFNKNYSIKILNFKDYNIFSILKKKIKNFTINHEYTWKSFCINLLLSEIFICLYYKENSTDFQLSNLFNYNLINILIELLKLNEKGILIDELFNFLRTITSYTEYCLYIYNNLDIIINEFSYFEISFQEKFLELFFFLLRDFNVIHLLIINNKFRYFNGIEKYLKISKDGSNRNLFLKLVNFFYSQISVYNQRKVEIIKTIGKHYISKAGIFL